MKVYLNSADGIADAITTMFFSRRTWTRELEEEIRDICFRVNDRTGRYVGSRFQDDNNQYAKWLNQLTKWGAKHITMLRFIDFSITVEGLHRAGQDDWDSHAKRYENRIIRSSTRLADFNNEMSEWYQGKIIPTDVALSLVGMKSPDTIDVDGITYVKATNGYIQKGMENNKDVKRGLYMLSIPSNFIFKVNLTEFGHVYKERNNDGTANPEVKILCENIADQIEGFQKQFNRELLLRIKN